MARIELQSVGLTFRVRPTTRNTLKDFFIGHLFRRNRNPIIEVKALQDITLQVQQGDRLGILGHNGAGKSTLLCVLAGIYQPSAGRVAVEGRISSLFNITLGFEPDATGWENIGFRSYLQGETPRSVGAKKHAIAEFSELGDFLNMPVRYYSSGMQMRLAFSIATAIDPEILLVDEALSVGDLGFLNKARARMMEIMDRAHLLVMVSHDLASLETMCNRVIWLDHGRMVMAGETKKVIDAYAASVAKQPPQPAPAAAA
jgi:ABC-type polysaccharide/polyol phosphate transport system ATPase subunit